MDIARIIENSDTLGKLPGQWFGSSQSVGQPEISIMANIERRSPYYALLVGLQPDLKVRTLSRVSLTPDAGALRGEMGSLGAYEVSTDDLITLAEYFRRQKFQSKAPEKGNFAAHFEGEKLVGTYEYDNGEKGTFQLSKTFSEGLMKNTLPPPSVEGTFTWEEFKLYISRFLKQNQILYRGQSSNQYSLQTTFHRTGRNNLYGYVSDEMTRLRHQINAISPYCYKDTREDLFGLISLAQHHGFPTPLLDWTASPYVAAFFAFDCLRERDIWYEKKDRQPVRIYAFDAGAWQTVAWPKVHSLKDPWPTLYFFHPLAHNNPRYYPQQAMAAFSNVENIENFVGAFEIGNPARKFIKRIDIQASERTKVEDDLRFMGITAASLFPGLDGTCKALRDQLFT